MSCLVCKICLKSYSVQIPPRVFNCGHTCCSSCLPKILITKTCHMCRIKLIHSDVQQYPVNYAILELVDESLNSNSFPNQLHSGILLRQRIEILSEKHEKVLSSADTSISNFLSIMNKVAVMKSNASKLQSFILKKEDDFNILEVNASLDEIEKLMKEVASSFFKESNSDCMVDFHSSQFENPKDFFMKIYNQICDGTYMAAKFTIDGVEKFAEISTRDNTLLIHAFRSSLKYKQSKLVEFGDVKKSYFEDYFRKVSVFFDLRSTESQLFQRVIVECLPHSNLTSYFIKICSGETGISCLGCPILGNFKRLIVDFRKNLKDEMSCENFLPKTINEIDCLKDNYYVWLNSTYGIFEIRLNDERKFDNVVGTVVDSEVLKKVDCPSDVIDCGIVLAL